MGKQLPNDQIFISKLTDSILENLGNENFGAKELAQVSGMSSSGLNRRLHKIINKTINQFIRETRLRKAMEMLQSDSLTVSEVSYRTGFGSPAYFNICFNKYYGYPPGKAKKGSFSNEEIISTVQNEAKQEPKLKIRRTLMISSGILFVAVLVYLVYPVFFKNSSAYGSLTSKNQIKSIAVLPFNNLSDSSANQYFIDGLMEEILTDLSRIHGLSVISRTSVEQFRKSTRSATEIAKKLNVDYIVEGSGQKYGNTFRLRVQLIKASTDSHIWAESYEQQILEVKDIFGIQSHVAQAIASELEAEITPEEKFIIEKVPTRNLTAYDFCLRANEETAKEQWPQFSPEAWKRKEVLLHKALECDSTYAQAYSGLAGILWVRRNRDYTITDNNILNNYLDSMLVLANIALSYDAKLAEAYIVRSAYYSFKGNTKKTLEELDNAIRYNPNDYTAYWNKVFIYQNLDLVKQLENVQKAASLNHGPELPGILREIGYIYYDAGFPEKGNEFYLEALKLDGDSVKYSDDLFWFIGSHEGDYKKATDYLEKRYSGDSVNTGVLELLGYFYSFLGQYQEALKYAKKYISVLQSSGQTDPPLEPFIAYAYLQNGYRKEAEYYFDKQLEVVNSHLYKSRHPEASIYADYALADIYACKGDIKRAYEQLMIFVKDQTVSLDWVILIKNDPLLNIIRNEPAFQKIERNVEDRYVAEHERVRKWLEEQGKL